MGRFVLAQIFKTIKIAILVTSKKPKESRRNKSTATEKDKARTNKMEVNDNLKIPTLVAQSKKDILHQKQASFG